MINLQEIKERQAHRAHQAFLDQMVHQDHQDQKVRQDHRGYPDYTANLVHKANLVYQV